MPDTEALVRILIAATHHELDRALARIKHCLDQLDDRQIWHRPGEGQNSIANLLMHLAGNLRQWIVVGLGGGEDLRDRPSEFAATTGPTKSELLGLLETTVEKVRQTLAGQTAGDLLRVRRIQGFEVTGLTAIFDSIPHFRGHTQEIVFRTRLLLGDKYKFAWQPTTKEQGGTE
jgi:uncharacterized damage-inducible protein DinB